jgi:Bifunctional DNA primase/polymerase, N-terminal
MTESPPEPPPQLQAALEYAASGIAVVASHFPVPSSDTDPSRPQGSLTCSCREPDCRTPARHPVWTVTVEDATRDTVELVGWWLGVPDANVATPAGAGFDLIEVRHPAPTARIARWLAMQGIAGPVICAGPGHHQFLVAPGGDGWRFTMTEHGGLARLGGGGGLILLPPSRLVDGDACTWLRPLGAPLPDGEVLWEALVRLPGGGQLATAVA